jgi:hypothetical protein
VGKQPKRLFLGEKTFFCGKKCKKKERGKLLTRSAGPRIAGNYVRLDPVLGGLQLRDDGAEECRGRRLLTPEAGVERKLDLQFSEIYLFKSIKFV